MVPSRRPTAPRRWLRELPGRSWSADRYGQTEHVLPLFLGFTEKLKKEIWCTSAWPSTRPSRQRNGRLAQSVRAPRLQRGCRWFESAIAHFRVLRNSSFAQAVFERRPCPRRWASAGSAAAAVAREVCFSQSASPGPSQPSTMLWGRVDACRHCSWRQTLLLASAKVFPRDVGHSGSDCLLRQARTVEDIRQRQSHLDKWQLIGH